MKKDVSKGTTNVQPAQQNEPSENPKKPDRPGNVVVRMIEAILRTVHIEFGKKQVNADGSSTESWFKFRR